MIRAALACLAIIMAAVLLYQGMVSSWSNAGLMALTLAVGVFIGLLLSLTLLWPDDDDSGDIHSKLSNENDSGI